MQGGNLIAQPVGIYDHASVNWEQPIQNGFGDSYNSVFERIIQRSDLLWNKRLPMMIQALFLKIP
jgi:hypothetical protein